VGRNKKQENRKGTKVKRRVKVRAGKYSLNLLPQEKSLAYNQCQKIYALIHKKLQLLGDFHAPGPLTSRP